MDTISLIYITTDSHQQATEIAETLLRERIIACANIMGEMTSLYRWESRVENSLEIALILKTRSSLVRDVTKRVEELHSYECPCVISWECDEAHPMFQKWILEETHVPETGDSESGGD